MVCLIDSHCNRSLKTSISTYMQYDICADGDYAGMQLIDVSLHCFQSNFASVKIKN